MLWQVLGKLFQVVGMVYATRCLGPDNVGVSRTIITLAMTLQLCLAFGLDAVAVRHVAKAGQAGEIAPAIFTFRFALGLLAAVLWAVAVLLSDLGGGEKMGMAARRAVLLVCCMDYSWLFQATEQMPRASRFQLVSSVMASLWFILFSKADRPSAATFTCYWWPTPWWSARFGGGCPVSLASCLSPARWRRGETITRGGYLAVQPRLLPVGQHGQVMTFFIIGKESGGLFGSAQYLVLALQMFLHYFGYSWHRA